MILTFPFYCAELTTSQVDQTQDELVNLKFRRRPFRTTVETNGNTYLNSSKILFFVCGFLIVTGKKITSSLGILIVSLSGSFE